MKRFNSSTVRPSTHLARDAKVLAGNKKENERIIRWAEEAQGYTKVREYRETIKVNLSRRVKRKLQGKVLNVSTREVLADRAVKNSKFRAELIALVEGKTPQEREERVPWWNRPTSN